jgi:hypothetical protein
MVLEWGLCKSICFVGGIYRGVGALEAVFYAAQRINISTCYASHIYMGRMYKQYYYYYYYNYYYNSSTSFLPLAPSLT